MNLSDKINTSRILFEEIVKNSLFSRGRVLYQASDGYIIRTWDTTCSNSEELRYISTKEALSDLQLVKEGASRLWGSDDSNWTYNSKTGYRCYTYA